MNFITFPVSGTNIFPISNSKLGGQLVTEFNLRSINTINTPSDIDYVVGPSYVHGKHDFDVQVYPGTSDTLEILPGRAVVNGHYVETFQPMLVSLQEANIELRRSGQSSNYLIGELAIGIKICYSTLSTMANAMLTENSDNMYEGVQLVVLPANELITPFDNTSKSLKQDNITAHLRLATFKYYNGQVVASSIYNNPDKLKFIDGERVRSIEDIIDSTYITNIGIQPDHLYVLSGHGSDIPEWCQATRSLMAWDKGLLKPEKLAGSGYSEQDTARFISNSINGTVSLRIPHMQIDGMKVLDENNNEVPGYYPPVILPLPVSDYDKDSPGTVDKSFIKHIKDISKRLNEYYNLPQGKQRGFIENLSDLSELPEINLKWNSGDYYVVGQDFTLSNVSDATAPSSMYIVVPGQVKAIQYLKYFIKTEFKQIETIDKQGNIISSSSHTYCHICTTQNNSTQIIRTYEQRNDKDVPYYVLITSSNVSLSTLLQDEAFSSLTGSLIKVLTGENNSINPVTGLITSNLGSSNQFPTFFDKDNILSGSSDVDNLDYCRFDTTTQDSENSTADSQENTITTHIATSYQYFYTVSEYTKQWSSAIQLTGSIPFASTQVIGGFLNVEKDDVPDGGYVYLDDNGFLRLVDYDLLRQGTLAYQLGEDITLSSGVDAQEIQDELDQYINERIAFPNSTQSKKSVNPNIINIRIELPEDDTTDTHEFTIKNIDSRFGASVYLHFTGKATNNTVINIQDCQKVRIESNLTVNTGNCPKINLYRSSLYYDPSVIDYIHKSGGIISGLSLWHEKVDSGDVELNVTGLKVSRSPEDIIQSAEVDYWNNNTANQDNHIFYALRSLTFSSSGEIIDFELLVGNDSTYTSAPNPVFTIIDDNFSLPQQPGLTYPVSALTHKLSVDGNFVSAYKPSDSVNWVLSDIKFSGQTGQYIDPDTGISKGTLAFLINTYSLACDTSHDVIGPWSSKNYHIVKGGAIS